MMSLYNETIIIKPLWSGVNCLMLGEKKLKEVIREFFYIHKFVFSTNNLNEIL